MLSNIKEQIAQTLFRADGNLNVAILRQPWFKQSALNIDILNLTQFLDPETSYKERIYCILNDISSVPRCSFCNNLCFFSPHAGQGYSETCTSPKCKTKHSRPKRNTTMLQKHGSLVSPKQRQLMKERVPNWHTKARQTMMERYGVELPGEMEDNAKKAIITKRQRYNGRMISNDTFDKIVIRRHEKFTNMSLQWGSVLSVQKRVDDIRHLFNITFECNKCNQIKNILGEIFEWRCQQKITPCSVCCPLTNVSIMELEIREFICQHISEDLVQYNDRTLIPPLELDITIPSKNLAFEIDGIFWHSTDGANKRINAKYHVSKTNECLKAGVNLIHIFETEWTLQKDIVKSRILQLLDIKQRVIYARKLQVREITDKHTVRDFLKCNHLQQSCSSVVSLGLYDNDTLLSVMTFGHPRYNKDVQWELLRFCNKIGYHIPGSASKLFNHFITHFKPDNILSYANRRWSPGNDTVYKTLGFEMKHVSDPSYYYFKSQDGMKLHNRVSFQKHKLADKLEIFDPSLSEMHNMWNNGYRTIWDCGNSVWVWKSREVEPSLD